MPDFKCAACRIRLRSDAVREMCPVCEVPMELVGELSDVVGFRLAYAADSFDSEAAAAALEPPPSWTER